LRNKKNFDNRSLIEENSTQAAKEIVKT